MKKLTESKVREFLNKHLNGEISCSRMTELLNEEVGIMPEPRKATFADVPVIKHDSESDWNEYTFSLDK
jgi:hypothetical protein